jgi:hypothetical protein
MWGKFDAAHVPSTSVVPQPVENVHQQGGDSSSDGHASSDEDPSFQPPLTSSAIRGQSRSSSSGDESSVPEHDWDSDRGMVSPAKENVIAKKKPAQVKVAPVQPKKKPAQVKVTPLTSKPPSSKPSSSKPSSSKPSSAKPSSAKPPSSSKPSSAKPPSSSGTYSTPSAKKKAKVTGRKSNDTSDDFIEVPPAKKQKTTKHTKK